MIHSGRRDPVYKVGHPGAEDSELPAGRQAGLLGLSRLLILSRFHPFCLSQTLLLGSLLFALLREPPGKCSHRSQARSSSRGRGWTEGDEIASGGVCLTSVSPVSTLVWLARGLSTSLPALLPPPWPKTKSASCSLFKGPWSSFPSCTHCTWQHTIHS